MEPPVRQPEAPSIAPAAVDDATASSRPSRPAGALALLYVVAAALYAVLAHSVKVPILFPDEFHYGHIAQSIADGKGATWNGAPEHVRSLLYLYAIATSWLVASGTDAYAIAKALGAALCCLAVVPVWLLARELVGSRLAFVPAVLTLAGTWMATTGLILTDNLAFPLATAALAAMVMALRVPASRWWIAAVVLAGLATFARLQGGALVPVFLAALLADSLRLGRSQLRARLRTQRAPLLVTGAISVAGLVLVLASNGSALGIYSSIQDYRPGPVKVLAATGQQLLALVVMTGVVPAVLAVAMALRPANWRDERSGPVLAVVLAAALGFGLQSGWFVAGFHARWDIERYMIYVVPLALVALMLAPRRVSWRTGVPTLAAVALLLLTTEEVQSPLEQRAVLAATRRLGDVVGTFGDHPGLGLMVAAGLIGLGALLILARTGASSSPERGLLAVGALVLVVLLAESQAAWHDQIRFSDHQRAQHPADLEWVDHAAHGPVGILNTATDNRAFQVTSFFNASIQGSYDALPGRVPLGPECQLTTGGDGTLSSSECTLPRTLLLENTVTLPTLYRETQLADHGLKGRLIRYAGAPRLLSLVADPCLQHGEPYGPADAESPPCRGLVAAHLWLDEPGVLTFSFLGGSAPHQGRLSGKLYDFAPGASRNVSTPVAAGDTTTTMELDWVTTTGAPLLSGVSLKLASGRTLRLG